MQDSLHQPLNAQALDEVERLRCSPGGRVEIAANIDHAQVAKAELAGGVRRRRRPLLACVDAAEPLAASRILDSVEMQLVAAFLAEEERALRVVDLEIGPHLPAGGYQAGRYRFGCATLKTQERAGHADGVNRDQDAGAVGAAGDQCRGAATVRSICVTPRGSGRSARACRARSGRTRGPERRYGQIFVKPAPEGLPLQHPVRYPRAMPAETRPR